jgi:spore maturation protein CgeB
MRSGAPNVASWNQPLSCAREMRFALSEQQSRGGQKGAPNVKGLFTPGKDFLVAQNGTEMQHPLQTLLQNEAMAHELAGHGLETILTRHTCAHRVDELLASYAELEVAGPQFPPATAMPPQPIEHLPPGQHRAFYNAPRCTLNITRADTVRAGYSPSIRLFEAAGCARPIISNYW